MLETVNNSEPLKNYLLKELHILHPYGQAIYGRRFMG